MAQEALWALDLDRVILVPTGRAPHKVIEADPGARVRLAMTELAAAEDDRFEVSSIEVDRPGLSYTVDTLEALRESHPGEELYFLMGADVAAGLGSWRSPERVLDLAKPVVAPREGVSMDEVEAVLRDLGSGPPHVIEMPPFAVSSTLIRERAARGMPIRFLVTDAVAEMIESQSIYREVR